MSGLFGIVDLTGESDIRQFLDSARAALSHLPWYSSDTWIAPGIPLGIGRVGIGIFNREPQPVTSADGSAVLLMSGELYEAALLQRQLEAAGYPPRDASHPELALCAFLAYGTDFADRLEGAFFIAIYDGGQRRLLLTNDRFGLYPHYYQHEGGKLAFGPEVKSVLRAPFVTKKLNVTAAVQYFRFQRLLGENTFHEGILLFPYGSVAQFDTQNASWKTHRYWDWDQIPDRPEVKFDEASHEAGRLLRRTIERLSSDDLRPGAFLSGGLDSRTILGMMPPRNPPPISATFGAKNSRDVYYAGRIAQAAGSRHHWFEFADGRWVLDNLDLHFKLTEGFHSWIHMHGISMLPRLRETMDVNLTGWDGGTVMGDSDHVNAIYNNPVDEWTMVVENFKRFNQSYTWPGLTEAEERLLYTPEFGKQAVGRAFDSLRDEFHPYWGFRKHYSAEYFFLINHCFRFTVNMVTTARSHMEVRFPFWDYQLIDYVFSLRPEVRGNKILYRDIITRETPKLALIPYDKDEFIPTVNPMQRNLQSLSVRARRRLGVFPKRPTLYADYENYLRHELHAWAEGILFDPRTEQRGIFDIPFVRSLMARHMAGHEEWTIGKIAPLITFEMVMRDYFG